MFGFFLPHKSLPRRGSRRKQPEPMKKTLRRQVVHQMPEPGDAGDEASVRTDHSSGTYPRPAVLPRSRPPPSPLPVPSERPHFEREWELRVSASRAWETPMVQRSLKTSRLKPRNTDNSSRVRRTPALRIHVAAHLAVCLLTRR